MEIGLWLFFLLGDILLLVGSVKRIKWLLSTWIGFSLLEILFELFRIVTILIAISIRTSSDKLMLLGFYGLRIVFNVWFISTVYGAKEEISILQSNRSNELEVRQL